MLSSSFCEQLAAYYSYVFSLIKVLEEFSFKQMKTWGQYKISYCCFCGRLGRVAFGIIYIASAKSRSVRGASHQPDFMDNY